MKRVDLASELHNLLSAAEAAELSRLLVYGAAPDLEAQRLMPKRISAVLILLVERIRQVARAVGGSMNPASVSAHHNAVPGPEGVHLREWSPRRQRQELEREQRRLDHEERRGRLQRRS